MNAHDDLTQVNVDINREEYKSEVGEDDWTPIIPGEGGDCDSYATAKFQALMNKGWPLLSLRLATCWVETGGYHCVLLVDLDLDGQTWVMDNRQTFPTEYQMLEYKWHKLQIAGTEKWCYAITFKE